MLHFRYLQNNAYECFPSSVELSFSVASATSCSKLGKKLRRGRRESKTWNQKILTGAFAVLTATLPVQNMHFDQCSCESLPVFTGPDPQGGGGTSNRERGRGAGRGPA